MHLFVQSLGFSSVQDQVDLAQATTNNQHEAPFAIPAFVLSTAPIPFVPSPSTLVSSPLAGPPALRGRTPSGQAFLRAGPVHGITGEPRASFPQRSRLRIATCPTRRAQVAPSRASGVLVRPAASRP